MIEYIYDTSPTITYSDSDKMGIMDILGEHLQAVTETFNRDTAHWHQESDRYKKMDVNFFGDPKKRARYDEKSVDLRSQGNVHFKAGRYPEARLLYTQSISAAIGGPLGALAYSNRF
jgi:hypothetical protein